MSKHTPGPWRIVGAGNKVVGDENDIAKVHFVNDTVEGPYNASLIAAAPEMLEALDLAVEQIEYAHKPKLILDSDTVLRIIKQAIAKARGES